MTKINLPGSFLHGVKVHRKVKKHMQQGKHAGRPYPDVKDLLPFLQNLRPVSKAFGYKVFVVNDIMVPRKEVRKSRHRGSRKRGRTVVTHWEWVSPLGLKGDCLISGALKAMFVQPEQFHALMEEAWGNKPISADRIHGFGPDRFAEQYMGSWVADAKS